MLYYPPRCRSYLLPLLFCHLSFLSFFSIAQEVFDPNQPGPERDQFSVAARCPLSCSNDGNWALYKSVDDLSSCDKPILFKLSLYTAIEDQTSSIGIRTCVVDNSSSRLGIRQTFVVPSTNSTASVFEDEQHTSEVRIHLRKKSTSDGIAIKETIIALADFLQEEKDSSTTALFAKSGNTIVGIYGGLQIRKKSLSALVRELPKHLPAEGVSQVAAQSCKGDSINAQIFGTFIDTTGDLVATQTALRSWNNATCLSGSWDADTTWEDASVSMIPGSQIAISPYSSNIHNSTLRKRATCSYTQAVDGDGCWAIADRCKVTQAKLAEYNGDSNLCSQNKIQKGSYYCCSAGTLPDFTPQPNSDGSCKTHAVQSTDLCDTIAKKYTMTVQQLRDRNKNTWGWQDCQYLMEKQLICISTGTPPMPAVNPIATCGPTVAGSKMPSNASKMNELNPCPLKACCNVWGNCGISKDFCILNPADTGAPGTTKPGANSCIANCGLKIVNNGSPPASFMRIGYFEAWNLERPCLHMLPRHINLNSYTHLHFAFGNISSAFDVQLGNLQPMFEDFKKLVGVKKIMSFGGWSFSTSADTAPIFREGVTPTERLTFANNVVKFASDNNLDGLDFDWEYPGAPDIPGIPPGSINDGPNYLEFLKSVRRRLPKEKTIGIAAPASFWYLKGFPIEEISKVVDYIVYMTYDLHGQWDYGNGWSTDGCKAGNCLRHHTNKTETELALVMVTKAGVPANKVIVGMPLYGRAFKMTSPGCTGPMCTFVGKESAAAPGRCTGTKGYISNFEIRDIIANKANVQQIQTAEGDEIVVYDGTEYVGWMSKQKYAERSSWVKGLNFGGTSDWAIDLDSDYDTGSGPGGTPGGDGSTTVIGGTTTVIGGVTTTLSGARGPITTVIGGTTTVIGGITTTVRNPFITVIGGTTTVISGTTTVIGGTTITLSSPITTVIGGTSTTLFPPGPITTVVGGITTTISGTRTVIGGTTTTINPGNSPTSTGGFPTVTNGRCTGRDCVNGRCVGLLCASFGCSGSDCSNGICIGLNCISLGCMGLNCINGVCRGDGCLSSGCVGSDCEGGRGGGGGSGHCFGLDCISIGCIGLDCGGGGSGGGRVCKGSNCSTRSCTGAECFSGTCTGSSCTPFGGGRGGGGSSPPDKQDPESCTSTGRFPTCTTKFVVITTVFPDLTSRSTSTSTSSTCYTVTACTGSATTVKTTVQSTTTSEYWCDQNCGSACTANLLERRALPTGVAQLDDPATLGNSFESFNLTIDKRDLPGPGSGDWSDWYNDLKGRSDTITIDNTAGSYGTRSALVEVRWGNAAQNIVLQDLVGCIGVIGVSNIGAFVAHFWDRGSILDEEGFYLDVVPILGRLKSNTNPLTLGATPLIFIFTGARLTTRTKTDEDIVTLETSFTGDPLFLPEGTDRIRAIIRDALPDARIKTYVYVRQVSEEIRKNGAWGRAAVLFDPNQRIAPDGTEWKGFAGLQVFTQALKQVDINWVNQEFQIWRVNGANDVANVVLQTDVGKVFEPCFGDFDGGCDGAEIVERGSEVTDVGPESVFGLGNPDPFELRDGNKIVRETNCVYRGGAYVPDANTEIKAGVITCDGRTVQCTRPFDNRATTCDGNKPVKSCGTLGKDCTKFYQHIATCKM